MYLLDVVRVNDQNEILVHHLSTWLITSIISGHLCRASKPSIVQRVSLGALLSMANLLEDAAADWQTLEDTFYRNVHLYDLSWTVRHLDRFYVSVDKNGGPIAMLRNPTIPTPYTSSSSSSTSQIQTYTSSSIPLSTVPMSTLTTSSASSSSSSFTQPILFEYIPGTSYLLLLAEDSTYRIYPPGSSSSLSSASASSNPSPSGSYETFQIGGQVGIEGIREAKMYDGGFVVRTLKGSFWDVKLGRRESGSVGPVAVGGAKKLADVKLAGESAGEDVATAGEVGCWAVLEPGGTESRQIGVLVSVDKTLVSLDEEDCVDQRLSAGPFLSLHPSPSGRLLALLLPPPPTSPHSGPSIWVVSSDFQTSHATIPYSSLLGASPDQAAEEIERWESSGGGRKPSGVGWCGEDAVGCAWDEGGEDGGGRVVLCGPGGGSLKYVYSGPVHLVTEIDGLRVISPESSDFIQKVPPPILHLLLPGSSHPTSLLLEAYTAHLARSLRSSSLLQLLRPDLSAAILGILDAAVHLWAPGMQKVCLKAAVWARAYLDGEEGEGDLGVAERGRELRVINCLREWDVGVGVSWEQYIRLPPTTILQLLTTRNMHLLALRLASFLSLDPDPILEHWACAKITSAPGRDDEELCREIVSKLKGGVSRMSNGAGASESGQGGVEEEGGVRGRFAGVAKMAWGAGRKGLATLLLNHEPRAANQVPLLLSMREDRLAFDKAIDSGDTDLVYHVLLHLKSRLVLGDFFRIVDDRPSAAALLELYAKEQDREMLKDFYYQDDRRLESARLRLEEGYQSSDATERLAAFKAASKFFSEDRDLSFESKTMDDAYQLLAAQRQIEKEQENKISLAGLSVNGTISALIAGGYGKRAERVRVDFKVPDKRYWYIKLQALVSVQDWPSLESFAKSKKSPIGYEPFVNLLCAKGFPREGARYVGRCETKVRVDLYVKCGDYSAAAQECKERGDKARLEFVLC
ncbi:Vacuolar assembly/sorting protein VPS16 [Phaffia rhodozyma]|uniref:Vacuolar assembly/sorting protein VPS16 n=1 Tax=Phaffia rhodozyma TaxID=264483 RepID=A0A0F7SJI0_PHARH|nr:Vacuolar assembly/sorting protein VPS16 [Phaffia rhodozyma]